MTRTDLEARLVAHAIVQPQLRAWMVEELDRDQVTPACWRLLVQLAEPDEEAVRATTAAQRRLADLAEGITVAQLLDWPSAVLVELLNRTEWSDAPVQAWERDLARVTGAAA